MAANQNVVDELVVKITLDASEYKKVDAQVDKLTSTTERKAKRTDNDRIKRTKESTAAVKQFAGSLKSLALTIGGVLGVAGGVTGLIGAVVSLTNFETGLRRATVSTGLSNREMQAWGSAARRLGADAQAGAAAIADLAKEQKQFNLTGNAPTMQALARLGVRVGPESNIQDVLAQAQQIYRGAAPGQKQQIESGLAAQGVSNDLILLIKSEKDVREAFTQSYAESSEENRKALDNVTGALESVRNAGIQLASTLVDTFQPEIEGFAKWVGEAAKNSESMAGAAGGLRMAFTKVGETIDVVVFGFQSLYQGMKAIIDWIDQKFGALFGGGKGQVKGALATVGDAIADTWSQLVADARRSGGAPVGAVTGTAGGVKLTPSAQARVAAGELNGGNAPTTGGAGRSARPTAQDVMQYLVGQGLTVPQAAAVAANIQGESGFNPAAFNPAGGGQGAMGLAQWRGARINAFRQRFGVNPTQATWQQQVDFMMTDPYERRLLNRSLSGPGGAADLGATFSRVFEGHGNMAEDLRRGQRAQQLERNFNPATGGAGGPQIAINGPVTVQANNPGEFIGGIQRVSNVQNYNAAVR